MSYLAMKDVWKNGCVWFGFSRPLPFFVQREALNRCMSIVAAAGWRQKHGMKCNLVRRLIIGLASITPSKASLFLNRSIVVKRFGQLNQWLCNEM